MAWIARVQTRLGWFAWIESEAGLERLTFGHATAREAEKALWGGGGSIPLQSHSDERGADGDLGEALTRYCDGEPIDFSGVRVAGNWADSFRTRVLTACRGIGWGETLTYGQLATLAGSPGAARAVGNFMAQNRIPIVIPCHRVVAAGRHLGNYSAPGGTGMKRRLLEMEAGGHPIMDAVHEITHMG